MELPDFKDLLKKHKVSLLLMKEPHYLKKQNKEVKDAFESLVENYDIRQVETRETVTNANRRDLIVHDLLSKLRAL